MPFQVFSMLIGSSAVLAVKLSIRRFLRDDALRGHRGLLARYTRQDTTSALLAHNVGRLLRIHRREVEGRRLSWEVREGWIGLCMAK